MARRSATFPVLSGCLLAAPAKAWEVPDCWRNGELSICAVGQSVSGGRTGGEQVFSIGVVRDPAKTVAFVGVIDKTWRMPHRENIRVTARVDALAPATLPASTNQSVLQIFMPLGDLATLADGGTFHIASPNFSESYDLAGSRLAIEALEQAWRRHEGGSDPFATASDPFADHAADPKPVADPTAEPIRRWGT